MWCITATVTSQLAMHVVSEVEKRELVTIVAMQAGWHGRGQSLRVGISSVSRKPSTPLPGVSAVHLYIRPTHRPCQVKEMGYADCPSSPCFDVQTSSIKADLCKCEVLAILEAVSRRSAFLTAQSKAARVVMQIEVVRAEDAASQMKGLLHILHPTCNGLFSSVRAELIFHRIRV